MGLRRVVTGHDAGGKSVFVADADVDEITLGLMPGSVFRHAWSCQEPPTVPGSTTDPAGPYFPPPGGVRVTQVIFPPADAGGGVPPEDVTAAAEEVEAKLPGLLGHMEQDDPGMHTTDTVDVGVVMQGEIWLELDDGAEKHLTQGDVIVQNGTRHRWHNRGSVPCLMTYVIVGAHRT